MNKPYSNITNQSSHEDPISSNSNELSVIEKPSKVKKTILALIGIVVFSLGILALFCVFTFIKMFSPLPDEQRYKYINEVKTAVDYSSAGEVITEGYDNGDGVFSPSVFRAEIEGNKAFKELNKRIQAISGISECIEGEIQLTCRKGQTEIYLRIDESSAHKVVFKVTDTSSGRNSNDKN